MVFTNIHYIYSLAHVKDLVNLSKYKIFFVDNLLTLIMNLISYDYSIPPNYNDNNKIESLLMMNE